MPRMAPRTALLLALFVAGCSGSSTASKSLSFDAHNAKAIVVIATYVTRAQEENIRAGRSLSTFWLECDPDGDHLRPGGKTFQTSVVAGAFSAEPAYLQPTVSVLQIDPGAYALIGAGFPHLMTTYVSLKPTRLHNGGPGSRQSWHNTVDPRVHVDPGAPVDPQRNFVFTVQPGQILYIGHFQFQKPTHVDRLTSINHYMDEDAARAALADYPGISGAMITLDPARPPQSVAR
jgi:hypothetical protein